MSRSGQAAGAAAFRVGQLVELESWEPRLQVCPCGFAALYSNGTYKNFNGLAQGASESLGQECSKTEHFCAIPPFRWS